MQLSQIYIYPIKALGGIQLTSSKLTDRGLQYDRRFMLTNLEGGMISQREFQQMALLKTKISGDKIQIYHQDQPNHALEIPLTLLSFRKSR